MRVDESGSDRQAACVDDIETGMMIRMRPYVVDVAIDQKNIKIFRRRPVSIQNARTNNSLFQCVTFFGSSGHPHNGQRTHRI